MLFPSTFFLKYLHIFITYNLLFQLKHSIPRQNYIKWVLCHTYQKATVPLGGKSIYASFLGDNPRDSREKNMYPSHFHKIKDFFQNAKNSEIITRGIGEKKSMREFLEIGEI
jgi:hypothetical protein